MKKIYVTDCDHDSMEIEQDILNNKAGSELVILDCKTEQDVINQCQDAEVILNQYAPITGHVLASLPKLKAVIRYGVGYNNVDIKAAEKLRIIVCNVPDYGTSEVADHSLTLMLSLSRKIVLLNHAMKKGNWSYIAAMPIYRLQEQTVGIVGLGRIGLSLAAKCHGVGFHIIGYDPYRQQDSLPEYVRWVGFDELISTADIISLNAPFTQNTEYLIGEKELAAMKPNSILVNTARGGMIDEPALYRALVDKKIGGAALDVFKKEPADPGNPLLALDNLICTPHMAWYSEQAQSDLKRKAAQEALNIANGHPPRCQVNNFN